MRARILRSDEWQNAEAFMAPLMPYIRPESADIVVVEQDGRIVGQLGLLRITHLEGLWISPEHRGNAGVMRALIRQAGALLQLRGEDWVIGSAASDQMRGFGERLGKQIPMELYAMWVGPKERL